MKLQWNMHLIKVPWSGIGSYREFISANRLLLLADLWDVIFSSSGCNVMGSYLDGCQSDYHSGIHQVSGDQRTPKPLKLVLNMGHGSSNHTSLVLSSITSVMVWISQPFRGQHLESDQAKPFWKGTVVAQRWLEIPNQSHRFHFIVIPPTSIMGGSLLGRQHSAYWPYCIIAIEALRW